MTSFLELKMSKSIRNRFNLYVRGISLMIENQCCDDIRNHVKKQISHHNKDLRSPMVLRKTISDELYTVKLRKLIPSEVWQ